MKKRPRMANYFLKSTFKLAKSPLGKFKTFTHGLGLIKNSKSNGMKVRAKYSAEVWLLKEVRLTHPPTHPHPHTFTPHTRTRTPMHILSITHSRTNRNLMPVVSRKTT